MENASETQAHSPSEELSPPEQELLNRAKEIAETVLAPSAQSVDTSGEPPAANLRALADAGLVGVTTPTEWGGQGAGGAFLRAYTETLTAACGTTWFVLTQHLGACAMIASSENPVLRETILRAMATGDHYVGVGFGHLRRPDPVLRAETLPNGQGWKLTGKAPWVTGWPLLKGVIFGAFLDDTDRHLYVYAPAAPGAHLRSSPPLPQCAMNAAATTEVILDGLVVPPDAFVKFSSREQMARGDEAGIAGAVPPPLGCATGAVNRLRALAEKRPNQPIMRQTADTLQAEINQCRREARKWADGPKDTADYKAGALNARAWAITLGVRCAHAYVAASSGGANSLDHPAQRIFREAMFYTLTAQTGDIMGATLEYLADCGDAPS